MQYLSIVVTNFNKNLIQLHLVLGVYSGFISCFLWGGDVKFDRSEYFPHRYSDVYFKAKHPCLAFFCSEFIAILASNEPYSLEL